MHTSQSFSNSLLEQDSFYSDLDKGLKARLIDAIVEMSKNNETVDHVIVALSSGCPTVILIWIARRLERSENCNDHSYEAIPTSLMWFP